MRTLACTLILACACGAKAPSTGGTGGTGASHPVPRIDGATPSVFALGSVDQTVTVTGAGIYEGTVATVDGRSASAELQGSGGLLVHLSNGLLDVAGSHPLVLHNPPPGGGDSAPQSLLVAPVLQLLGAAFASSQDLILRFDQAVDATDAANVAYYPLLPSLQVMAASVEEGGATVHLRTAAAPPDTTFTLNVDQRLRAATGLPLGSSSTIAVFRSFDALPDPLPGVMTLSFGCAVGSVMEVKGLWVDSHAYFLTDRIGNQVQIVPHDDSIAAAFLGSDGVYPGLHHDGTPEGCPGGIAQDQGALMAPVSAAVQEPAGSVLVADTGHGRLLRYPLGHGVDVVADKLTSPALLGIFGGDAWVAEPGRILRIAPDASHEPLPIGGPGTGDLQFGFGTDDGRGPAASAAWGGSPILVVEPGNERVQRLRDATTSDGWIGAGHEHGFASGGACCSAGSEVGQFGDPRGVQVLASGAFYVIDGATGGRLQKFDADGKPVRQITLDYEPWGIALNAGILVVAGTDGALHSYVP